MYSLHTSTHNFGVPRRPWTRLKRQRGVKVQLWFRGMKWIYVGQELYGKTTLMTLWKYATRVYEVWASDITSWADEREGSGHRASIQKSIPHLVMRYMLSATTAQPIHPQTLLVPFQLKLNGNRRPGWQQQMSKQRDQTLSCADEDPASRLFAVNLLNFFKIIYGSRMFRWRILMGTKAPSLHYICYNRPLIIRDLHSVCTPSYLRP